MRFSVIIPLRKINDYIKEAIPYYQKQNFKNFEIIIVSEANENEKFPKTRIVKVGKVPPSEKRNIGAKHAKGEILAFIDDDAYPEKDWLENASKIFEDKNIVAVGGPGIVPKNATFFQRISSKVYELSSGKTGIRYGKGKKKYIDDWPTCNFFVRQKEFNSVGGFDSRYWGGEDTQLCYSLIKTEKKMIYDPNIVVYHHPRKTLKQHLKQTFFWGIWRGFFMKTYKQSVQLVFFVPIFFIVWFFAGGFLAFFNFQIKIVYMAFLFLYFFYLLMLGIRTRNLKLFFPVIFVSFLTQIVYGVGCCIGILKKNPIRKTFNPAEKIKV